MSTAIPRDDDDNQEQDIVASNVAVRVYELAEGIAPDLSQPIHLVDLLLDSRERMVNLTTGAEVDIKKIEANAPEHLKDWVHLLTFVAKSGSTDTLTAINKIVKGIEYLKKQVEGTFGYATYDLVLEKLEEIASNELRKLEQRSHVNTSLGGSTTIINNNVNAVNSSVDLTTVYHSGQKLVGAEIGELRKAIVAAFTPDELAILLSERLNVRWMDIKSGSTYEAQVFNLIVKVTETSGMTGQLIEAVISAKPQSPYLQSLISRYVSPQSSSGNNYIYGTDISGNTFIGTQRTYRA